MFAPAESLPFAIDVSLNARFLPNELAVRIARRRVQDADQILRAESEGEQGASDLGLDRTQEARDLLSYLQAASHPPLLRATLSIAVAAGSEERARATRRDVSPSLRRGASASATRGSAAALPAAPPGSTDAARRLRRHAHDRAGGRDDADRRPPRRFGFRLLSRSHPLGLAPARPLQPQGGVGEQPEHRPSLRWGPRARARQRSPRSSSTRAFSTAHG